MFANYTMCVLYLKQSGFIFKTIILERQSPLPSTYGGPRSELWKPFRGEPHGQDCHRQQSRNSHIYIYIYIKIYTHKKYWATVANMHAHTPTIGRLSPTCTHNNYWATVANMDARARILCIFIIFISQTSQHQ